MCLCAPLQAVSATALMLPQSLFADLRATYQAKRDRMLDTLRSAGFKALKPQGSYFIMCDWRGVAPARVIDNIQDKHLGRHLARFPVCKKDETLRAAAEKLSKLGKL